MGTFFLSVHSFQKWKKARYLLPYCFSLLLSAPNLNHCVSHTIDKDTAIRRGFLIFLLICLQALKRTDETGMAVAVFPYYRVSRLFVYVYER